MATMSKDDLKTFIADQTVPMIKDAVGKSIADTVKEQVEAAIEPLKQRQATYESHVRGAGSTEEAPRKREKGMAFSRCIVAMAEAKRQGGGIDKAIGLLDKWGDKDIAVAWTKALAATDASAGGFLIPGGFSQEIIELYRPMAVVRSLNPEIIQMGMGSMRIPKITAGVTGTYIGENQNIVREQPQFGSVVLNFKKLAVLVPISNDLMRYSPMSVDAIVRADATRGLAATEDRAFLRGDGTSGTPRGLLYQINTAHRVVANSTVNLDNVTSDLASLVRLVQEANVPIDQSRPGWIMSPRSWQYLTTVRLANGPYAFRDEILNRQTLWGYPVKVTTQVPNVGVVATGSEVYFVCFADAIIGEAMNLSVDVSGDAAYYDGSSVQAAFSLDQTVVRVIAEHDFAMRRDTSGAVLTDVRWAA